MKYCTEYRYKCRMCGEIFSPENSFDYNWMDAMKETMGAIERPTKGNSRPGLLTIHASCGGKNNRQNQFGIADFIGAKRELFNKP